MTIKRTGKYMKPGAKSSAPGVVFTVSIETANTNVRANIRTIARTFARAFVSRSVYRRGRWAEPETSVHMTTESALEWIRSRSVERRTNWVIAENAQSALTLLRWWEHAENQGIRVVRRRGAGSNPAKDSSRDSSIHVENLVVRTGTTVLTYYERGVRFRWASYRQFVPTGLDTAERSTGDSDVGGRHGKADVGGAFTSAERECIALARGFTRLCEFWRARARAPFGCTVGQLAVGMLRSYIAPKSICTHSDEDAHRLERAASFGGRASVWYVGTIGRWDGPKLRLPLDDGDYSEPHLDTRLHHVDVRSMYPTILRDYDYPIRLIGVREKVRPEEAVGLSRSFGVIARVRMNARVPEYPRRSGERVLYQTGIIQTCLTGPEIIRAAEESEILSVDEMCVYAIGRPFSEAASAMLDLRADADRRGNTTDGTFAKLLANSMAGKLAQRAGGWERWQEMDAPGEWGEQHLYDTRADKRTRVRYIAGMCWQWVDDKTGRGPYTFAFAYLAAYGRLMMRNIRESLPARSVVAQDTDGLWVTDEGIAALADLGHPQHDGPGALRLTRAVESARFWSPRHYCAGAEWTLAGFSQAFVSEDMSKIKDVYEPSMWSQKHLSSPGQMHKHVRESMLTLADVGGIIGPDGWVRPAQAHKSLLDGTG